MRPYGLDLSPPAVVPKNQGVPLSGRMGGLKKRCEKQLKCRIKRPVRIDNLLHYDIGLLVIIR